MWDYDKLFADGNIIGIKNCYRDEVFNNVVDITTNVNWLEGYKNEELSFKHQYVDVDDKIKHGYTTDFEIQYIIRLDEHGNVIEKLFDREVDMKLEPEPMPKLETGMFVRVKNYNETKLGIIYTEANHIIYQDGGYDFVYEDEIMGKGIYSQIVEIYNQDACAFDYCEDDVLIWRDPYYQAYLDSKSK